jgi:LCP family protein required for cell wall assembly
MSNEQDKYNDYDVDEAFSNGMSRSRRRRAAKRNGTDTPIRKSVSPEKKKVKISMSAADMDRPISRSNSGGDGGVTDNAVADGDGKPKKKMSPKAKFITIVVSIVSVFCIILGSIVIYTCLDGNPDNDPKGVISLLGNGLFGGNSDSDNDGSTELVSTSSIPERTQFVIMCTDEDGTRTDTIMVGCYNSETNGISLISVPRDTIVSVSAADYRTMREEFPEPGKQVMKINAIHHYSGNELGPEMLVKYLNEILGTDIKYYVRIDFKAFHYLVDSIGGIEFDVPQDMDYDDPSQDLAIHLKAGLQTLDGDKAEQLVRFRKDNYGGGYINGDLGRIEMQQEFMKVLLAKVASIDTITKNPTAYVNAMFSYITTNVTIADAIKYASVLGKIDASKIETYTLPGDVASLYGISGYEMDSEKTAELVYDIFERPVSEMTETTTDGKDSASKDDKETADSKDASIMVLNGGYTSGKAGTVKEMLEENGYTVSGKGDYSGDKESKTRIYVAREGLGTDLEQYFVDAETIVDKSETEDYDITIVIGTGE